MIPSVGGRAELVAKSTNCAGFSWGHDSRSLIVANSDENMALRIIGLDRHSLSTIPGTESNFYPVLSPNGRYLLVRTNDSIRAVDLDTHNSRQLATQADDIGYAQWSRVERYVYFNRFLGATPAFYRVSATDGRPA